MARPNSWARREIATEQTGPKRPIAMKTASGPWPRRWDRRKTFLRPPRSAGSRPCDRWSGSDAWPPSSDRLRGLVHQLAPGDGLQILIVDLLPVGLGQIE